MTIVGRKQAIRWCFTINNFNDTEEQLVIALKDKPGVKCAVAEKEHLTDGTPHIQGFVAFHKKKDFNALKRELGGRAHLEVAKGSEWDNYRYCTKEGGANIILQYGCFTQETESKRNKDQVASDILKDIAELDEDAFKEKYPSWYLGNFQKYDELKMRADVEKMQIWNGDLKKKNFWIWGKPGVGKSKLARRGLPQSEIYPKNFNKWWNGLRRTHKRVILDDYPAAPQGDTLAQHMKLWGDRYPLALEIKGSHISRVPDFQFIVTSNYSIDQCFSKEEDREAIRRRYNEIEMKEGDNLNDFLQIDDN